MDYISSPQLPIPSAAASIAVTTGASWSSSAWSEMLASAPSDGLLSAISVATTDTNERQFEVDIGVGGAGSETLICTIKGRSRKVLGGIGEDCLFNLPVLIDAIPSGSRIACRMRSDTGTTNWNIGASYYAKPITGIALTSAQPIKCLPAAAGATAVVSDTVAWASGSWTQLTASFPANAILVGVVMYGGQQWEIDIGTGGAGSEVVRTTLRGAGSNTEPSQHFQVMFPIPLDIFTSGARVAARSRFKSGSRSLNLALMYMEKPL